MRQAEAIQMVSGTYMFREKKTFNENLTILFISQR